MSITGSRASCWVDRSTKRLVLELQLCAQRLLELNLVHIRAMDPGKATAGFIHSRQVRFERRKRFAQSVPRFTLSRAGRYLYAYPICRTILPGLWGAPASMLCARRASESGRTEPTRVVILPSSNNAVIVCRRAVVTSA